MHSSAGPESARAYKDMDISTIGIDSTLHRPEPVRVLRNSENFRLKEEADKINADCLALLCLVPPCACLRTPASI